MSDPASLGSLHPWEHQGSFSPSAELHLLCIPRVFLSPQGRQGEELGSSSHWVRHSLLLPRALLGALNTTGLSGVELEHEENSAAQEIPWRSCGCCWHRQGLCWAHSLEGYGDSECALSCHSATTSCHVLGTWGCPQ